MPRHRPERPLTREQSEQLNAPLGALPGERRSDCKHRFVPIGALVGAQHWHRCVDCGYARPVPPKPASP
jgi:hypothetical protein